MEAKYQALIKRFPELKQDEFLSKHTSICIGGTADLFWVCRDVEELPDFLAELEKLNIKFFILGGGTNILFDSKGFRGCVIKIVDLNFTFDANEIVASSGVRLILLAKESMKRGLSGLEWANGVPGTIGGAIFGNAGCSGTDISQNLEKAVLYSKEKGIFEANKNYFQFSYRNSILKKTKEIVLKVHLKLKNDKVDFEKSNQMIEFRNIKQPIGCTNGSFFRNPDGDSAGRLIEAVGLKGHKIGNAQISDKHANFFLNLGGAKSDDILALCDLAKLKVKEQFGVDLEEEVIVVK